MESVPVKSTGVEPNGEEAKETAIGDGNTGPKESSPPSKTIPVNPSEDAKMEAVEAVDPSQKTTEIGENLDPKEEGSTATAEAVGENAATSLSSPIPRKKRRRIERESLHDEQSDDDETDAPMDISLAQLKRQVLGRDLKVDENEEDEDDAELRQVRALMNAPDAGDADADADAKPEAATAKNADLQLANKNALSLSEKLRKDLMCAICHEVVYPPVALPCGHSFCQPCIDWWLDHDEACRCPTCRRSTHKTSPNLALKACVMAMFGPEIVQRIQNRKKMRPKGEDGGAHDDGYQVLSELKDETWHYCGVRTRGVSAPTVQIRRSIVLDAEDQRMQLALAVHITPFKEEDGSFRVELCLLTMEEDEAVDSGFPITVMSAEDEYFVCENSRFRYTHLDVQMKDDHGNLSPLARVSADARDGQFRYTLDPSESAGSVESIRALLFRHSETRSQLEIDLSGLQNLAGGSSVVPSNRPTVERMHRNRYYSDEEEDDDDENQNEFEEDGFLVGDDEASNVEGAFSDESIDEGDRCTICNDGGELMICDGGDKHPGCGKSFHSGCVNRSAIPDGDWICQACAKAAGIETDVEGHEFPEAGEDSETKRDEEPSKPDEPADADRHSVDEQSEVEGAFSDDDSSENQLLKGNDDDDSESNEKLDDEDKPPGNPSGNGNKGGTKRRFVLEDSDSD
mmetsp:Transcript_20050/g.49895  ORF Transcript_20050/g.49895 Transcript_20050/m.49895 type:complete len:685 (+) Transcript_20050:95-2149(+)